MARERGHGESSHVVWIGRQGIKDWDLLKIVLEGDWTLVTRNATTFVGQMLHRERAASISGLTYMQASFASTAQREWISTCNAICLTQRSMKSTEMATSSTWF
jgi:hypothetical protein